MKCVANFKSRKAVGAEPKMKELMTVGEVRRIWNAGHGGDVAYIDLEERARAEEVESGVVVDSKSRRETRLTRETIEP